MNAATVVLLFVLSVALGVVIGVVCTVRLAIWMDNAAAQRRRDDLRALTPFAADVVGDIESL